MEDSFNEIRTIRCVSFCFERFFDWFFPRGSEEQPGKLVRDYYSAPGTRERFHSCRYILATRFILFPPWNRVPTAKNNKRFGGRARSILMRSIRGNLVMTGRSSIHLCTRLLSRHVGTPLFRLRFPRSRIMGERKVRKIDCSGSRKRKRIQDERFNHHSNWSG